MPQLRVSMPQLKILPVATKTWSSQKKKKHSIRKQKALLIHSGCRPVAQEAKAVFVPCSDDQQAL